MTSHDKEAAERESLADQWKRELIADIKAQRDGFYRHVKACKEGGWYRGQMEQHLAVLDSICAALSSPAEAGGTDHLQAAFDAINSFIKPGVLQGNGCDDTAQRNGLIIAANLVMQQIEASNRE